MICAALPGSCTPASWITIWFLPCLRISGSATPSLAMRLRMIEIERSMQDASQVLFFGGTAFSTTSSPPWRSSPRVTFLCTGEPGTPRAATPASASAIRPTRIRCERLLDTRRSRGRLAFGRRDGLAPVLGLRLFIGRLLHAVGRCNGPPVDPHQRARRDLDVDDVVLDRLDGAVDAPGGEDLVARAELVLHLELLHGAATLGTDQQEPHQAEKRDEHDHVTHVASSGERWSRASASSLYDRSSPRSIAARAPATRSSTKRRLCKLSRRGPRISRWLSR